MNHLDTIAERFSEIQEKICSILETADGSATFGKSSWKKDIGSGLTRVLKSGAVIEKAGVNFSLVQGTVSSKMETFLGVKAGNYAATGISSIIHPKNPHVPIIHMNVRYFALNNGTDWFGGGIDLTPHYVDCDEASWFHRELKTICDKYHPHFYAEFKNQADDYFFIPHRNETRGIGGIFFDKLSPSEDMSRTKIFNFCCDLANAYPIIYSEIMARKANTAFNKSEKKWQKLRRGRYVEFNLVYDRGTKFGLESGGNTESILMSLPTEVKWEYDIQPAQGSKEFETLQLLKKNINWAAWQENGHSKTA